MYWVRKWMGLCDVDCFGLLAGFRIETIFAVVQSSWKFLYANTELKRLVIRWMVGVMLTVCCWRLVRLHCDRFLMIKLVKETSTGDGRWNVHETETTKTYETTATATALRVVAVVRLRTGEGAIRPDPVRRTAPCVHARSPGRECVRLGQVGAAARRIHTRRVPDPARRILSPSVRRGHPSLVDSHLTPSVCRLPRPHPELSWTEPNRTEPFSLPPGGVRNWNRISRRAPLSATVYGPY